MKIIVYGILVAGLMMLSTCKSHQKIKEDNSDIVFKKAQYQTWTAGIQGGGAGYNVTIEVEKNSNITLDSIYFKKWKAKLHKTDENNTYVALINDGSNSESITLSGSSNSSGETELNSVYTLEDDEAIVSYKKAGVPKNQEITLDKGVPFINPRY